MVIDKYKNFIFDLDNTLINCHIYYINRKKEFGERTAQRTGLTAEFCQSILEEIDLLATKLPNAFSNKRFPTSFKAASLACDALGDHEPNQYAAHEMFMLGNGVFHEEYPLYSGVGETLNYLTKQGKNLFLCTKGEYSVQMNKILKNSLFDYFPHQHIYIVGKKTKQELGKIIVDHSLGLTETIMIGDSLKDDIKSALDCGIDAAYVLPKTEEPRWRYEDSQNVLPTYEIKEVFELLSMK